MKNNAGFSTPPRRRVTFPQTPPHTPMRIQSLSSVRGTPSSRGVTRSYRNSGPVFLRRNLGRRVAGALAQAAPAPIRMAFNAYQAARGLHSMYRSAVGSRGGGGSSSRARASGGGRSAAPGMNGGRFRKPKKNSKKLNKYLSQGFVHTTEIHGTVSDPDCVYVGHSTFSGQQLIELMCQALLRKLWAKSGWICRSVHQNIPGYFANTSNAWRITIQRKNIDTGAISSFNYDGIFGTNITIYQIVGDQQIGLAPLFPALLDVFRDYATGQGGAGGSSNNIDIPYRIILSKEEENVTQFHQFDCEIYFDQELVHFFSKSDMKIQNRTLNAEGTGSTDNVSNNPLEGRLYHFKGGCPRARVDGAQLVEAMLDRTGVLTARSAQIAPTDQSVAQVFKEPPKPQVFWNCSKSSKVKLDPGMCKQDGIYFSGKMPFLKFLKSMQYGFGPSPNFKQVNLFGKSALIALEDMINVNAVANINIAYEVNREYGMYFSSRVPKTALGHRYTVTLSNNP